MVSIRKWGNHLLVQLLDRKERRKAYKARTLVVSNHWDGSVQVFYHFMLGYFAPLAVWLARTKTPRIAVRDCGPMNVWFDLLAPQTDVQIIKPGIALHSIVGNRTKSKVVTGLDYPDRHKSQRLQSARLAVLGLCELPEEVPTQTLVIDRATSDPFHSGRESETEMSGAQRRSVPNLRHLAEAYLAPGTFCIADMAAQPPLEQIALASSAHTLLAQHGAGLTHMLWMPPGSTIVEIQPPLPPEAKDVFRLLASALGHKYVCVRQSSVHANVELTDLVEALDSTSTSIPGLLL